MSYPFDPFISPVPISLKPSKTNKKPVIKKIEPRATKVIQTPDPLKQKLMEGKPLIQKLLRAKEIDAKLTMKRKHNQKDGEYFALLEEFHTNSKDIEIESYKGEKK